MSKKIPVQALYDDCAMMLREKWGYIFGTAGILWTVKRQAAATNEMTRRYGSKWIGHKVTDCSGVMVYIWHQFGLTIPHGSSSMVRQGYIVDCGSTPHPGWAALADPTPDTPDNNHIGIVQADGITVVEAKGTQSGVVTSKVTDSKWTKFGRFRDVDYDGKGVEPMPEKENQYNVKVVTSGGTLRLRSKPSTSAEVLTTIPNGTVVTAYGEEKGWTSVIYKGTAGYCMSSYLEKTDEPKTQTVREYGVMIPCSTREEAETVLKLFTGAELIGGEE